MTAFAVATGLDQCRIPRSVKRDENKTLGDWVDILQESMSLNRTRFVCGDFPLFDPTATERVADRCLSSLVQRTPTFYAFPLIPYSSIIIRPKFQLYNSI